MLLGSVANHAWAEDSLYFKLGRGGDVICEQESKSAPVPGFRLTGIRNRRWTPQITVNANDNEREPDGADGPVRKARGQSSPDQSGADKRPGPRATGGKALKALLTLGKEPQLVKAIAQTAACSVPSVYNSMANSLEHGFVIKVGTMYQITEKGIKAAS